MTNRFVFDTNTILSAVLLAKSKPRQAFDKAKGEGRLLVSNEVIEELNDVLRRKEFEKYVTEGLRVEFLTALLRDSELVEITEKVRECRDPGDDKFLSIAVSGNANYIISGDKDLLALHPFRKIQILTATQYLKQENK
jgi:uncharacterized protein